MNNNIDRPGIIINDKYGRRLFTRIVASDGIVNYFEVGKKPKEIEELNMDEVYLIPLDISALGKRKRGKFYGYKYTFTSGQHNIVKLENGMPELDMAHVQLCVSVRRFRFTIKLNGELNVDKVYDPLYPTRVFDINCLARDAGKYLLIETLSVIDEFNKFYINKEC